MNNNQCLTSACRYCRYYQPEGRRGGACQQLGVSVEGQWKACALALPPFSHAWENLEEIVLLENSLALNISSVKNLESKTLESSQFFQSKHN
jgi:hypothetical protein